MPKWMEYLVLSATGKSRLTASQQARLSALDMQDQAVGDRIAPWTFPILIGMGIVIMAILSLSASC